MNKKQQKLVSLLKTIVANDPTLLSATSTPSRCKAIVDEELSGYEREKKVLLSAIDAGVLTKLSKASAGQNAKLVASQLHALMVSDFVDTLGAAWAIVTWSHVLGVSIGNVLGEANPKLPGGAQKTPRAVAQQPAAKATPQQQKPAAVRLFPRRLLVRYTSNLWQKIIGYLRKITSHTWNLFYKMPKKRLGQLFRWMTTVVVFSCKMAVAFPVWWMRWFLNSIRFVSGLRFFNRYFVGVLVLCGFTFVAWSYRAEVESYFRSPQSREQTMVDRLARMQGEMSEEQVSVSAEIRSAVDKATKEQRDLHGEQSKRIAVLETLLQEMRNATEEIHKNQKAGEIRFDTKLQNSRLSLSSQLDTKLQNSGLSLSSHLDAKLGSQAVKTARQHKELCEQFQTSSAQIASKIAQLERSIDATAQDIPGLKEGVLEELTPALSKGISAHIYYEAGVRHLRNQEFEKAEEDLRSAIEYGRNDTWVYHFYGNSLAFQNKLRGAKCAYDKAIEIDSSNKRAIDSRNYVLSQLGLPEPNPDPFADEEEDIFADEDDLFADDSDPFADDEEDQ